MAEGTLTLIVDIDGALHRFDTTALAAGDLSKPLAQIGARLRRRAIERYRAQDFAPLAASTIAKRAQKGLRNLETKLTGDLRRAHGRASPRPPRGLLAAMVNAGGSLSSVLAAETRGVRNRRAVLAEFQTRHRRPLEERAQGHELSLKQLVSLGKREDRAAARAVGRPILGSLPSTLEVEVGGGTVTLRSRTHQQWTDVHNSGGTAGHGARIPERKTVTVDESDGDAIEEILLEHHLLAFKGAAP